MGPPSIIVLLLFSVFALFFLALGAVIVFLITKILKAKVTLKGIASVIALFLLFFLISTIWVRGTQEGATFQFFGDSRVYQGTNVYHGFPLVWMGLFEPDDASARNLFYLPETILFEGLLVDFATWLVVSTVIFCVAIRFSSRNANQPST